MRCVTIRGSDDVGGGTCAAPHPEYARHDQRLGGESPSWRLMAPTTSQRQLLLREEGGKEVRGETATLGTHGVPEAFAVGWAARMRRGGPGELARHGGARCPSRGRYVDAMGARRRPLVLFGEISTGVSGCPSAPSGVFVGWCETAMLARAPLAVEKSAEAVLPVGILSVAGKGRTRSRASGRSCS